MAGTVLQILEPTEYNFSALTTNGTTTIYAAQNIDVSQWTEGTLLIRVHSRNITNATSKVMVNIVSVLPTADDPAYPYIDADAVATFDIQTATNQQQLHRVAFSANFGAMVSLVIVGEQKGSANDQVVAKISVALSLKS